MNQVRLFFFCVMAFVLPVNTVLARLPAPVKMASVHAAHHDQSHHQHENAASDEQKPQLHLHTGLFGKVSEHWHQPAAAMVVDCVKACQTMPNLAFFESPFALPLPLSAVLVEHPPVTLSSVTLAPLEDPPKLRA